MAAERALVMGLGAFGGGLGVTRHLARAGYAVTVTDLRTEGQLAPALEALADLELERTLGEHRAEDFERADLVVVNPAVAPGHALVEHARQRGARITSEIELFLEAVRGRVVGVTGTEGKSSTCHLLAHLLRGAGWAVHLGGNFGGSLLQALDAIGPEHVVVLELSSYQLEALERPERAGRRVEAVCVTNVRADHLERHGDVDAYRRAKQRILELLPAGGVVLLPAEEAPHWDVPTDRLRRLFAETPMPEADLWIEPRGFVRRGERLAELERLHLPGAFQRLNALAALGLAAELGVEPAALGAALERVPPLPHRLESLGRFAGRHVIDNGVSTTPDSTLSALRSLAPGVHLLLGGRRKRLPLEELVTVAAERVARAVVFGESREALREALAGAGVACVAHAGLAEATRDALEGAPVGDTVLFSPACASFDAFLNFRERALAFRAALPPRDEGAAVTG